MKLNDVRKLAIKSQMDIRFRISNGSECVIDKHGLARVPGLRAVPDFNLEDEFARALEFSVNAQRTSRSGLESIVSNEPTVDHAHEDE